MSLKSNTEWKQWGKEDPLYGVASWANKQKDGSSPWTEKDFYALGESDWRDFLAHWNQYGISKGTCIEIGCGAGRMTRALATFFDRVAAVDVSEGMIERARKVVGPNVEFLLVDSTQIPVSDQSASAIFSTHVLQHLDSVEIGYGYFREAYRVLRPGGSLMIHVPLYQFPNESGPWGPLWRRIYTGVRVVSSLKADVHRRRGTKSMRGTPYPVGALREFLLSLGFRGVEYRIFPTSSNSKLHSFVFATKEAPRF
jgi:ubiquinone/menaquinone biosynthesis C-methylase UbiE